MASTSNHQKFVFKYGGPEIKFLEAKADYGDVVPPEEHIQMMLKMIERLVEKLMKFVKEAERNGTKLSEKNKRGQRAIYYGEKNYTKISKNVEEEDIEKVRIEELGPTVDYDKLADYFQKFYPAVEGYHEDKYQLSDEQFFNLMKMCLKRFNMHNRDPQKPTISPDALYYALYKIFPLTGSQHRMSIIFPTLVEYGRKEDLHLEGWKKERDEKTKRYFSTEGNYFRVCLPYKQKDHCRTECYKRIRFSEETKESIPNFNNKYFVLYLPKDLSVEHRYAGFLDALFGAKNSETKPVDFCKIAKRYLKETNRTCEDLYEYILDLNSIQFKTPLPVTVRTEYNKRRLEFDQVRKECDRKFNKEVEADFLEMVKKEEAELGTKMTDEERTELNNEHYYTKLNEEPLYGPCTHFGPCGPDQENCSCKKWCTEQCRCDENCSRRFPGCRCPPGQCHEGQTDIDGKGNPVDCICVAEWRECVRDLCNGCLKHENKTTVTEDDKCKNFRFQRGVECLVKAGTSKIAGTGAFLTKDVVAGQSIGEYLGAHISVAEASRRDGLFYYGISYIYHLPSRLGCIDSAFVGNETRFLNHDHVNPNCAIICRLVDGKPRIVVVALMDIKAGTELLFNYGYDEKGAEQMFKMTPAQRAPQLQKASSSGSNDNTPSTSRRSGSIRACSTRRRTRRTSNVADENTEDDNSKRLRDNVSKQQNLHLRI